MRRGRGGGGLFLRSEGVALVGFGCEYPSIAYVVEKEGLLDCTLLFGALGMAARINTHVFLIVDTVGAKRKHTFAKHVHNILDKLFNPHSCYVLHQSAMISIIYSKDSSERQSSIYQEIRPFQPFPKMQSPNFCSCPKPNAADDTCTLSYKRNVGIIRNV